MKLKWSLMELRRYQDDVLLLDGNIDLTGSLKERMNDVLDASLINVTGAISVDRDERFFVDLTLTVTLTLPSSRSLEPTDIDLVVPFSEVYMAPDVNPNDMDEFEGEELVFSLENEVLDLQKPIEDTILAAIPIKILTEEEKVAKDLPSGDGWELKLEEDGSYENDEFDIPENSPFSVLKELSMFDDEDEE